MKNHPKDKLNDMFISMEIYSITGKLVLKIQQYHNIVAFILNHFKLPQFKCQYIKYFV